MTDLNETGIRISHKELIALYRLLLANEDSLDRTQRELQRRVCARVYAELSVEQVEGIDDYYRSL